MLTSRFRTALLGWSALWLFAIGCGPALDDGLPQNEAQPDAPEGIIFLGPEEALPPDFTIQALTATEQSQMLAAVNAVRTKNKVCGGVNYPAAAALTLNAKLVTASEKHAADMAAKNYFSHNSQSGKTFAQRINDAGYSYSYAGENIAAGYTTLAAAVNGWYASSGHCKNFMSKNFTNVGFGKGYSASSTYKYYWVADLARPR